ncbi:fibronectin type III domain-containing protein [bacterium]|nr:fibronectin type III domain-containing protein [bacterium]
MNFKSKIYTIATVSGLLLVLVIGFTLLSSKRDLTTQKSQAATIITTPIVTELPVPTPTTEPTLLRARNQDVPLKVLGSVDNQKEHSYLYTELTSKGIISNLSSNSVNILWITEAPQQTNLKFGTAENRLTRTSVNTEAVYLHEATIDQLSANTLYYYTGHAPIVDSFTTPVSLPANKAPEKNISGVIKDANGTCIVRVVLSRGEESSAYATVVTTTANWSFSLNKIRTSDYSAYFEAKNSDSVIIDALCVSSGKVLSTGVKKFTLFSLLGTSGEIKVSREN